MKQTKIERFIGLLYDNYNTVYNILQRQCIYYTVYIIYVIIRDNYPVYITVHLYRKSCRGEFSCGAETCQAGSGLWPYKECGLVVLAEYQDICYILFILPIYDYIITAIYGHVRNSLTGLVKTRWKQTF